MRPVRYLLHGLGPSLPQRREDSITAASGSRKQRTSDFCYCGGFRPPGWRPIHALRRPAAEKRQGTKSREVEHRGGRGRYGDLMPASSSVVDVMLAECGRRICTLMRSEACDRRLGKRWELINELRMR
jgi:hypothetical protein